MHRTTVSISRVSNAVFGNWPITSATYVSPLPEIMTTGKIHLSARWSRYQYYAPYPAKMRVLSRRARDASRKKNERRDKSSGSRKRTSRKIQARPSRWNLLPIFFFLRPENGVESTCRVSTVERAPREVRQGADISLYYAITRPRPQYWAKQPLNPRSRFHSEFYLYSSTATKDLPISQKWNTPEQFI